MPRILQYTPPWLSRPSPGSTIFTDPPTAEPTSAPSKRSSQLGIPHAADSPDTFQGPRRLLARRGTEIFTAVGNKLRWTELGKIKDDWEEQSSAGRTSTPRAGDRDADMRVEAPSYRILTVPVYQPIRQLIISPSEVFLAILTEHTIHIAVLPDRSRLRDHDRSPLKLKTYQLGPTTHVIPQSPLVCALWHPLAVATTSTDCLVTVTAEAAVRVWELDLANQWSFDRPALAVDLKKLIDGTSCDQDFEPSGFGKNRGFSADVFDMETTSACFGGRALDEEDGWAAMTLWCSMRNGDVYALCPLMPSKWRPSATLIPSLSTTVVANVAGIHGPDSSAEDRRQHEQQYQWLQDIDQTAPLDAASPADEPHDEIRHRPANPSAIPKLQGPFEFDWGAESGDVEVTDIHVIGAKIDASEDLMDEEEDESFREFVAERDGLTATIICLATTDGRAHFLLDLDGVSGQWLPPSGKNSFRVPTSASRELLFLDSTVMGSSSAESSSWPVFSADVGSRYHLYLTTSHRVTFLSVGDWATSLDSELSHLADEGGLGLRLDAMCEQDIVFTEDVLDIAGKQAGTPATSATPLSAPLIFQEPALGYLMLTCAGSDPYAVVFDQTDERWDEFGASLAAAGYATASTRHGDVRRPDLTGLAIHPSPPRETYTPAGVFYDTTKMAPLNGLLTKHLPHHQQRAAKQEIRLSPATLELVNAAHRTISVQAAHLEAAAADLFRTCDRLREELANQVQQMSGLSARMQRIHAATGGAGDGHERSFDQRLDHARHRQSDLVGRYEALRRTVARVGASGRELSAAETDWLREMHTMARRVGGRLTRDDDHHKDGDDDRDGDGDGDGDEEDGQVVEAATEDEEDEDDISRPSISLSDRLDTVRQLATALVARSQALSAAAGGRDGSGQGDGPGYGQSPGHGGGHGGGSLSVPSKVQRARIAEAMAMVERESAVIEAVMARLERLQLES